MGKKDAVNFRQMWHQNNTQKCEGDEKVKKE